MADSTGVVKQAGEIPFHDVAAGTATRTQLLLGPHAKPKVDPAPEAKTVRPKNTEPNFGDLRNVETH